MLIKEWFVSCVWPDLVICWASLLAQLVKNPPAMPETWVLSLAGEDPLEEGMVTPSSPLAWRIPWTEEPGGLQLTGLQRAGHGWAPKPSTLICWLEWVRGSAPSSDGLIDETWLGLVRG